MYFLTRLQELLYYGPNHRVGQVEQLDLLGFFARELGMTLENEDQRSVSLNPSFLLLD